MNYPKSFKTLRWTQFDAALTTTLIFWQHKQVKLGLAKTNVDNLSIKLATAFFFSNKNVHYAYMIFLFHRYIFINHLFECSMFQKIVQKHQKQQH